MSRGQPYVILATDVLRALFALGLGEVEGSLLAFAIENTWGRTAKRGRKGTEWPDTTPCELDLNALVTLLKFPYQRLQEARMRLIKSKILLKAEGGFLVNKDADSWVKAPTDLPRLAPEILDYAASAQKAKPSVESNISNTVDRVFPGDASENTNTVDRVPSANSNTLDRVFSGDKNTVDRVFPTPSNTVDRVSALEERTRGNPTGSNTNPTGFHSNARTIENAAAEDAEKPNPNARIDTPKQRGLALSDDEPFISPPDALPLPPSESEDDPETSRLVKRLYPFVLQSTKTRTTPDGNGEIADFMVRQARMWRSQNYPAAVIGDSIKKAVVAGLASKPIPFSKYVVNCLNTYAEAQRLLASHPEKPKAVPPPGGYLQAPPRPAKADRTPTGA